MARAVTFARDERHRLRRRRQRRSFSGEIFYVNADKLPNGGQAFHRILFNDHGQTKTLLQLVKEKNVREGQSSVIRADLRMGVGPKGQLFVMNKYDGTIRLLVP